MNKTSATHRNEAKLITVSNLTAMTPYESPQCLPLRYKVTVVMVKSNIVAFGGWENSALGVMTYRQTSGHAKARSP